MAHNPETTVRKIFTLPRELWEQTEDYRFDMRIKTEAEAIRRLMELGLYSKERDEVTKTIITMAQEILHSNSITLNTEAAMEAARAVLDLWEKVDEIAAIEVEKFHPASRFVFLTALSATPWFANHGSEVFKVAEGAVLKAYREAEAAGSKDPYGQVFNIVRDGSIRRYGGKSIPRA